MSMAGAYFSPNKYFHVGIMPCHDKKLEASRRDLHQDGGEPDVDLVITTQEWWTLLTDAVKSEVVADVNAYLQTLPMAHVATSLKGGVENDVDVTLVVPPSDVIAGKEQQEEDVIMMDANSEKFFAFGSGGYADFIFRFASQELFGHAVRGELSWTPCENPQSGRIASSRVAASVKKRRDFLSVTLYRHVDGSYSSLQQSEQDVAVLRFATAYGLQNIQRVLLPFSSNTSSAALSFDYVEAMACPSGCPNGGGQVREGNVREIPAETRKRVTETQEIMKMQQSDGHSSNPLDYPSDLIPTGPFGPEAKRLLHTRFHVVPPLQHTMGAIAGVAVQDTNW
jgi:iron only hydrogenase large subunit-like protein